MTSVRDRRDPPRRGRGRHHQHRGGVGNADHVPDPARVRRPAGDRQRLQHRRPGARARCPARSATAASSPASAPRLLRLGVGVAARRRRRRACCCSCCPSTAFDAIVPVLIALGCVLVVLGPRIQRWVAARAEARGGHARPRRLVGVAGGARSPACTAATSAPPRACC